MIFYLCRLFDRTQVDGINFIGQVFEKIKSHSGKQKKFNEWLEVAWRFDVDQIMTEYIRLTNIAFGTAHNAPPVFLLDEVQCLCSMTKVKSSLKIDGTPQLHSQLSLLLTRLSGKLKPVCICTGTNSGKIISITEKSTILPKVLSLTPLVKEYCELWEQLTAYSNRSSSQYPEIKTDDTDLRDALVFASYQIPRLIFVAHSIWFNLRKLGIVSNRKYYLQKFEQEAIKYYGEMVNIL